MMADYMTRHSGSSNSLMAENLQNMLIDRYDTKWWLVIVYDQITGLDNRYWEGAWHSAAHYVKYI